MISLKSSPRSSLAFNSSRPIVRMLWVPNAAFRCGWSISGRSWRSSPSRASQPDPMRVRDGRPGSLGLLVDLGHERLVGHRGANVARVRLARRELDLLRGEVLVGDESEEVIDDVQ